MDPTTARKTWRTAEVIHGMIYFAPEAAARYASLGFPAQVAGVDAAKIPGRMGYFASRGAALGPASAELIIATFFNFNPVLVRAVIPEAWSFADPASVLDARLDAADAALRRYLGGSIGGPAIEELATLVRRAADAAAEHPEGRPLFAAHASLPWPDDPHLVLWHAQTMLREFRGDGHVAALLLEDLAGVDALVIHGATGEVPPAVLQQTRAWPDDEWGAAVERMRSRGFLEPRGDLALTDAGRTHRQWVEDRTDHLSIPAYAVLGEDGCTRLRELARPLSAAIIEAGGIPGRRASSASEH
jgi:hypothetical protein